MPISFQCGKCGRKYKTPEETAGKRVRCKQCGEVMQVPEAPDLGAAVDLYGLLDEPTGTPSEAPEESSPIPARGREGKKPSGKSKKKGIPALLAKVDEWPGGRPVWLSVFGVGALFATILALTHLTTTLMIIPVMGFLCFLVAGVLALIATFRQGVLAFLNMLCGLSASICFFGSLAGRSIMPWYDALIVMALSVVFFFAKAKRLDLYRQPFVLGLVGFVLIVGPVIVVGFLAGRTSSTDRTPPTDTSGIAVRGPAVRVQPGPGPAPSPAQPPAPARKLVFPDLGPGVESEPGIVVREVQLPGGPGPGESGKLWLYLPIGTHDPKSLPCVLIAGAGSNLISGMRLAEGDRVEHLPYVRAGFAVLAYELDGMLANRQKPSDAEMREAGRKFLAARAGLVNANVAIEFLLAKVPEVDPDRLFTAGHSSAATMALLLAEHEPRIKGCVAYAPETDLEASFGTRGLIGIRLLGLTPLVADYSPRKHEAKLNCPVFLFQARDDVAGGSGAEDCAQRLRQLGKSVTLEVVPSGGHYDSMIQQGLPRGVEWLRGLAATGARRGA